MYFEGITHTNCGGDIELFPPYIGQRVIGCNRCRFTYTCESLERPIEVVYRLVADGTFLDEDLDED